MVDLLKNWSHTCPLCVQARALCVFKARKHLGGIFVFDLYGQVQKEVEIETQSGMGCIKCI